MASSFSMWPLITRAVDFYQCELLSPFRVGRTVFEHRSLTFWGRYIVSWPFTFAAFRTAVAVERSVFHNEFISWEGLKFSFRTNYVEMMHAVDLRRWREVWVPCVAAVAIVSWDHRVRECVAEAMYHLLDRSSVQRALRKRERVLA